jgi:ankyrin repeat protein
MTRRFRVLSRAVGGVALVLVIGTQCGIAQQTTRKVADQALLMAAEAGRADLVAYALENGADPDARDLREEAFTPLMLAALNGHTPTAMKLLDAGAEVDARSARDWTALMYAARDGYADTVSALVDRGAKPDIADSAQGNTALILAAGGAHEGAVGALLRGGADPNRAASDGFTALMAVANVRKSLPTAVDLIAAGADNGRTVPAQRCGRRRAGDGRAYATAARVLRGGF